MNKPKPKAKPAKTAEKQPLKKAAPEASAAAAPDLEPVAATDDGDDTDYDDDDDDIIEDSTGEDCEDAEGSDLMIDPDASEDIVVTDADGKKAKALKQTPPFGKAYPPKGGAAGR